MPDHYVAFWNVENLFDSVTSPTRPDWLQKELKRELKGWTKTVLAKKIAQLGSIILQMNGGTGPDILGLCEVENRAVLDQLVAALAPLGRAYAVSHFDGDDQRGIDVAFIYDTAKFKLIGDTYQHHVLKRSATRDLFQITLETNAGNSFVLIGNHWPSRIPDQVATEPYRIMVGETLAYWHKRIIQVMGKDTPILAMGDFNDEPFDRSVRNYALSVRNRKRVVGAKTDMFFNLMWGNVGRGDASYVFTSRPNVLDQFWVSKGIAKAGKTFSVDETDVEVLRFPEMVKGKYNAPRRFGQPSKASKFDDGGYSDHFPIAMILREN